MTHTAGGMTSISKPLRFYINGKEYVVEHGFEASYTLAEYLREHTGLKGTKVTCREGGCGACSVALTRFDPQRGQEETHTVNSCLVPLYGLHGRSVTTIEGLGGRKHGYHAIQRRLAEFNSSQCGYCTPGVAMALYGTLKGNSMATEEDLEKALEGNICRCTGYRAIMDAAKSFAARDGDASCMDIEDLSPCHGSCSRGGHVDETREVQADPLCFPTTSGTWYKTASLSNLFQLLQDNADKRVRLVVGNTGNGVVKSWSDVYIDMQDIEELNCFKVEDQGVTFGGNVTMATMTRKCNELAEHGGFRYLAYELALHLANIGNKAIRNSGSWAGNLMIQHDQPSFPSDIAPAFEALGAKLTIASKEERIEASVDEWMGMDMTGKVVLSVTLPALPDNQVYKVIKVKARQGGSQAYVTGGFLIHMAPSTKVNAIRIAYNGVGNKLIRARNVEEYLLGKNISDQEAVTSALDILRNDQSEGIAYCNQSRSKHNVAVNLVYKFLVFCRRHHVPPSLSGSLSLTPRGVSSAAQDYQEVSDNFPLNKAIPNVHALDLVSGEARYTDDLPRLERELIAAFVPSQHARGRIVHIDTTKAKAVPGVHSVMLSADLRPVQGNQVLAADRVDYAGQPVAMVLADDERTAKRAARLVDVKMDNIEKPILDSSEAIEKKHFHDIEMKKSKGDALGVMDTCQHILEGECKMDSQCHLYMENLVTVAVPTEQGVEVWTSTQYPTHVQTHVADALGVPSSAISINVTRIGGGFGGKNFAPTPFAVMTCLAADKTNRPVRFPLSLKNCMESASKRYAFVGKYKVGFDNSGKIRALHLKLYPDFGYIPTPLLSSFLSRSIPQVDGSYFIPNILVEGFAVKTHKNPPTSMRAPDKLPVSNIMADMVEQIAHFLHEPVWDIQSRNLLEEGQVNFADFVMKESRLENVWSQMKETSKLNQWQHEIDNFNRDHTWVKRGLATVPATYPIVYSLAMQYPAYIAIYAHDGSVAVSHGAVEMGQGLHTKVCQIIAWKFGIPMDLIKVKTTNTLTANNAGTNGASMAMEMLSRSVMDCCDILIERIRPIREQMTGSTWSEVIKKCFDDRVDLSAHSRCVEESKMRYNVYGALATEAEVDILTGERRINRVDVVIDCGESLNPSVDVGQVEGALVLGLGYMLYEHEQYEPQSGRLLTNSLWDYKVPTCLDIPTKMNVHLLKNAPHTLGVIPAKALGEPPMCMTAGFLHAVRKAIEASRESRGKPGFIRMGIPATLDAVNALCDVETRDLLVN